MYHGDSRQQDQAVDTVMKALYQQLDEHDVGTDRPFNAEEGFNRLAERMRREAGPALQPGGGPAGETAGEASAPSHLEPARDVAVDEEQAPARLLTVGEAAQMAGVKKKTIDKLIRSGELNTAGEGGPSRIPEDALKAYIEGRRRKYRKTKIVIAGLGAVAAGVAVAIVATRDKRLTEPDEIAGAVGAPVLASIPALYPATVAEWMTVLDGYRHALAQTRQLHNALLELGVIERPTDGCSVVLVTLSADPGALALGPQLAVYAASLGIPTTLVIGPGSDTEATAALRAACATESVRQAGNLRSISHKAIGDVKREYVAGKLTILVTAVDADARPVVQALRATTAILVGVSAGAATADQLARVAAVGEDRAVTGILIANPLTADRGTGSVLGPGGVPGHRQPDRMSDITAEAVR